MDTSNGATFECSITAIYYSRYNWTHNTSTSCRCRFVRKILSDLTIDTFVHAYTYQLVVAKLYHCNFIFSIQLEASRKTHGNVCAIYSKVYSIPPKLNVNIDQIYLHVFQQVVKEYERLRVLNIYMFEEWMVRDKSM